MIVQILAIGIVIGLLLFLYSVSIEKRGLGGARSRKGELATNMWVAMSLDCDFEPTKNAFGPGRSVHPNEKWSVSMTKND